MKILFFLRQLFVKKPNHQLRWTPSDFELGKKWAKSQPHPTQKNKTLWDKIYSPRAESTEVIHELNQIIQK